MENISVIIEGKRIRSLGTDIEMPKDAQIIDASGKTVMPGMIDSHVHHMGMKGSERVTDGILRPKELALIKSIYDSKDYLASGFTTAKDTGGMNAIYLKKSVAEGTLSGLPRIVAGGYLLGQTGGHADLLFFPVECADVRTGSHGGRMGSMGLICDGVDECIKAARYSLRHGADFVKIIASPSAYDDRGMQPDVEFNSDEVKAIVETAAQAGKFVTAHCHNSRSAKNLITNGVKTIDHASDMNDEVIELAKTHGAIFVSSLTCSRLNIDHGLEHGRPPDMIEKSKKGWNLVCESYKRINKAGATLAIGTDLCGPPLLPLGKSALELELLVKYCEFTAMEAIVAATKHGAMAAFMEDETGTIEPGKLADILLIDGDPLKDIAILQDLSKILMVMLEGRIEIDRGIRYIDN